MLKYIEILHDELNNIATRLQKCYRVTFDWTFHCFVTNENIIAEEFLTIPETFAFDVWTRQMTFRYVQSPDKYEVSTHLAYIYYSM